MLHARVKRVIADVLGCKTFEWSQLSRRVGCKSERIRQHGTQIVAL
jgi:hypothetical protein